MLKSLDAVLPSLVALLAVAVVAIGPLGPIAGVPTAQAQILVVLALVALAFYSSSRPQAAAVPRPVLLYAAVSIVLFWWLMISSAWTLSQAQFRNDITSLWLLIALVLALTFSLTPGSVRRLLRYGCLASAALGVYILSGYLLSGDFSGYTSVVRNFYLGAAMAVGIGAVGASLQWLVAEQPRWPWGLAALLLLPALALSLARGALISATLVILLFALLALLSRPPGAGSSGRRDRLLGLGLVLAALSLTVFMAFQVDFTRAKLEELLAGEIGERQAIWETALASVEEAGLVGHGLGSSGLISEGRESGYPHNLFLQVWLDAGLLGLLALLLIALLPFYLFLRRLWRRDLRHDLRHSLHQDLAWLPFLGIYLFLLLEYSKSFNFYSARSLFIFGICAVWLLSSDPRTQRRARAELPPPRVSFENWR
ncbi:MAG: O-antigen ligase family protein [Deinococcota bacterium]|nr:O-antigen ligase family protein [Deinococcota bacterium]